ncbi:hypothetical protein CWO85_02670 [Candidatus Phytoplasma ziziphi]|uniref:Uncharacterized protein n=1 Tax=Ziziphus jujuba witches'-broom phytoplasma TaxID=135727 RepID=A0A660HN30_ZIZJU|nr:hypothetical protein [Candidatus Phytoplasma ziziphi]AYJ01392.1 hypothetical protein CWO85_02670 [Candidatus Phytoplasma ziziphi]
MEIEAENTRIQNDVQQETNKRIDSVVDTQKTQEETQTNQGGQITEIKDTLQDHNTHLVKLEERTVSIGGTQDDIKKTQKQQGEKSQEQDAKIEKQGEKITEQGKEQEKTNKKVDSTQKQLNNAIDTTNANLERQEEINNDLQGQIVRK